MLSRMREAYDETGSTDRAIELGLARTGKLVTSGALILMFAFLVLSTSPGYEVKPLAIGLAAGIIIDATVIRALLVPALMRMFGDANWWMPAWTRRSAHPAPGADTADGGRERVARPARAIGWRRVQRRHPLLRCSGRRGFESATVPSPRRPAGPVTPHRSGAWRASAAESPREGPDSSGVEADRCRSQFRGGSDHRSDPRPHRRWRVSRFVVVCCACPPLRVSWHGIRYIGLRFDLLRERKGWRRH
jgi:hypothetical protein